jgi:hypothetical protein
MAMYGIAGPPANSASKAMQQPDLHRCSRTCTASLGRMLQPQRVLRCPRFHLATAILAAHSRPMETVGRLRPHNTARSTCADSCCVLRTRPTGPSRLACTHRTSPTTTAPEFLASITLRGSDAGLVTSPQAVLNMVMRRGRDRVVMDSTHLITHLYQGESMMGDGKR